MKVEHGLMPTLSATYKVYLKKRTPIIISERGATISLKDVTAKLQDKMIPFEVFDLRKAKLLQGKTS